MPGKQARVLCPVCQEPIPPDETECENCGAFVIDEAVVRLSRALGLDRDRALKLFEAGFRHPTQLRNRDPNRVLEKGEVGLLFICTNCGGFVAGADTRCPRCAAEFESEPEAGAAEEDILDLVLCPICGADNDPEIAECEVCGEPLKEVKQPERARASEISEAAPVREMAGFEKSLEKVDDFLEETELPTPAPTPHPLPLREAGIVPSTPTTPKVSPSPPAKPVVTAVREKGTPVPTSWAPTILPEKPRPSAPRAIPAQPILPTPVIRMRVKPTPPIPPQTPALTRLPTKRLQGDVPGRIPRKRIRAGTRQKFVASPETVGGFLLASAAGLLLAGALKQQPVIVGITAFLIGVAAYLVLVAFIAHVRRPSALDLVLLAGGVLVELAVPFVRGGPAGGYAAIVLAGAGTVPFAWAARRLLRRPERILLAMASVLPMVGQGLAVVADPAYATSLAWTAGLIALMPWPAALAGVEILRRKSTTILRRQLVRAERDIQRKDYERSLQEYDHAIASTRADIPGREIPWYGKGATLILLGRYTEALRAIDTALDINPHNEVAWVNKGNALTKMGQLVDALRCFNAAIKVNGLYEVAWNNKGNALARLGKYEESLRCYDRALEIDSGYRGAWVNMGFVLTKLGRFDEAASCADNALRLERGRPVDAA